jgi:uncharacterized protein (TIGR03067 family)
MGEQAERDRLAGTWVLQTLVQDGKEPEERPSTWQFHGEVVAMDRFPTPYTLDPTRMPKRISITATPTDPSLKPEQLAGIYEIDGDTLRIALATKRNEPPGGFKPGDGVSVMTFKRQKDEAAGRPADPTTEPGTQPAVHTPIDLSTPRAAATSFMVALYSGDADGALASSVWTDDQRQSLVMAARLYAAFQRLRAATQRRFDQPYHIRHFPADVDAIRQGLADVEVDQKGDEATVGQGTLQLRRAGGKWKVKAGVQADGYATQSTLLKGLSDVLGETAEEVAAGKYASFEEMEKAIDGKCKKRLPDLNNP